MKEVIQSIIDEYMEWTWEDYSVTFRLILEKHLSNKVIIDKWELEETWEKMSTSKAILKTKGSISYSNGYSDWYRQAIADLTDLLDNK